MVAKATENLLSKPACPLPLQGLLPAEKQRALASVAKQLSFEMPQSKVVPVGSPPEAQPAPAPASEPRRAPTASAPLTVFADASLAAPAALPAPAVAAAAAPARQVLAVLGDRTNQQAPAAGTKRMKQLSAKLHVAHSQKVAPQVGGWLAGTGGEGSARDMGGRS